MDVKVVLKNKVVNREILSNSAVLNSAVLNSAVLNLVTDLMVSLNVLSCHSCAMILCMK
jgi:hypothetical protein